MSGGEDSFVLPLNNPVPEIPQSIPSLAVGDVPACAHNHDESLMQIAEIGVPQNSLEEYLRVMTPRVQQATLSETVEFCVYDAARDVMRGHLWRGEEESLLERVVAIDSSPEGWVWQHQEPLLIADVVAETRFDTMEPQRQHGIESCTLIPVNSVRNRLGVLELGNSRCAACSEGSEFLARISRMIALGMENALARQALLRGQESLAALAGMNNVLLMEREVEKLIPMLVAEFRRVTHNDLAVLSLLDDNQRCFRLYAVYPADREMPSGPQTSIPMDDMPSVRAFRSRKVEFFSERDLASVDSDAARNILRNGVRSQVSAPLLTAGAVLGTLSVASYRPDAFMAEDGLLLQQIASQVALALENARAFREIADLKRRLETQELKEPSGTEIHEAFEEMVGDSAALKQVLMQTRTVAGSSATVLIEGETGTGKELVAHALHRMSHRAKGPFIKLNCAAIPTGLLESELFGHEKGAFTGAITQKIGRLETANGGTLLLDEVGDIPLELQPKLLRVLQDQEFERLGSNKTVHVDVRIVAATNHELAKRVAEKQFRADLYYRLHVFPIYVPPLRERAEDIPLLVRHFVRKFALRMDKRIDTIPTATMETLCGWNWPGNIRELENFVERSVIMTEGSVLWAPMIAELRLALAEKSTRDTSLESAEREHIRSVLQQTRGVISGARGAAAILGLKRTTLQSKMEKLGILRQSAAD